MARRCPKCGSKNITYSREFVKTESGPGTAATLIGCLFAPLWFVLWLLFFLFKIMLMSIPMILIHFLNLCLGFLWLVSFAWIVFPRPRIRRPEWRHGAKREEKKNEKAVYRTVAVCQNCGHTWKV